MDEEEQDEVVEDEYGIAVVVHEAKEFAQAVLSLIALLQNLRDFAS